MLFFLPWGLSSWITSLSVSVRLVVTILVLRAGALPGSLSRTAIVKQLLDPLNYDSNIPPKFNEDEPIEVTIGLFVNNIDTINDNSMDFSMTIFLRMNWSDDRLAYSHLSNDTTVSLDPRMLDLVWKPDLYFPNEKRAYMHDVMVPNRYLRIAPGGAISFSTRVSLKLSCHMTLYKFPLDTQTCSIDIESYAYSLEKITFAWTPTSHSPVEIPNIELPQFQLIDHKVASFIRNYSTGQFAALRVCFILRRDIGFYMIHTYVPSVLIVILSWVSFWISADAVPARISLGVTTVLTMTTQSSGVTSASPKVSYVKAIDVWMLACLLFVFGALLEFAFVNVLSRGQDKREYRQRSTQDETSNKDEKFQTSITSEREVQHTYNQSSPDVFILEKSVRVDVISRYVFPLAFFTFNSLYWVAYYYAPDPIVKDIFRN